MIVRVEYCDVYEIEVPDEIFNDAEDEDEWQKRFGIIATNIKNQKDIERIVIYLMLVLGKTGFKKNY